MSTELLRHFTAAALAVGKSMEGITLDTQLADLAIDSITLFEMVEMIEDRLSIRLANSGLHRVRTVGDLLMLVQQAIPVHQGLGGNSEQNAG